MDMRGMLEAIGIVKDQPFNPSAADRATLDKAARRALEMARWILVEDLGRSPGGTPEGVTSISEARSARATHLPCTA
jgi:hypothetical protein